MVVDQMTYRIKGAIFCTNLVESNKDILLLQILFHIIQILKHIKQINVNHLQFLLGPREANVSSSYFAFLLIHIGLEILVIPAPKSLHPKTILIFSFS